MEDGDGMILGSDIAQILWSTGEESVVNLVVYSKLLTISQPMAGVWEWFLLVVLLWQRHYRQLLACEL